MLATNHYLTGVAVAGALGNPIAVLPAAFVSHFILDALPISAFLIRQSAA